MKISILLMVFILVASAYIYIQNNWLQVTKLAVGIENLPVDFEGFKILHLADLHGKWFGAEQGKIIAKVKSKEPDVIVFTGDLIDASACEAAPGLNLLSGLTDFAPVYFVTGNHEWWSGCYRDSLKPDILNTGVEILSDSFVLLRHNSGEIILTGVDDPDKKRANGADFSFVLDNLAAGTPEDSVKILLTHRPERFKDYHSFDLVFAGHTHGGQIRLPFIGGLAAPHQGFFPRYTAGLYEVEETKMVVTRGLGNSIIPVRINNRPDIVSVVLERKQ